LGRYLLVFGRPVLSNLMQLIRGASWMPFAMLTMYSSSLNAMDVILFYWGIGSMIAAIIGVWYLRSFLQIQKNNFTWSWLRTAFLKSRYYFAVAILTHIHVYADRFIIQLHLGEESVGLIGFYQNFANTIQTFVQTGVVSILLARLLQTTQMFDWQAVHTISRRMLIISLALSGIISIALFISMPLIINKLDRKEYEPLLEIFPWLLIGNIIVVAGLTPHLRLYALHRDSLLMRIYLFIAPLSVLSNMILVPRFGIHGAVAVFVCTAALQTILNFYFARVATRHSRGSISRQKIKL
jgi:O-antigen/teichoic acid export membrane protein